MAPPNATKSPVLASKHTDEKGAFAFTDLEPKPYRVYCVKQDGINNRSADKRVTLEPGKTVQLELELSQVKSTGASRAQRLPVVSFPSAEAAFGSTGLARIRWAIRPAAARTPRAMITMKASLTRPTSRPAVASWSRASSVQVTLSWSSLISRIRTPEAKACSVAESRPVPAK